jgi:hypothetical protein
VVHAKPKIDIKESDGRSSVQGILSFDMDMY